MGVQWGWMICHADAVEEEVLEEAQQHIKFFLKTKKHQNTCIHT